MIRDERTRMELTRDYGRMDGLWAALELVQALASVESKADGIAALKRAERVIRDRWLDVRDDIRAREGIER